MGGELAYLKNAALCEWTSLEVVGIVLLAVKWHVWESLDMLVIGDHLLADRHIVIRSPRAGRLAGSAPSILSREPGVKTRPTTGLVRLSLYDVSTPPAAVCTPLLTTR